MNTPNHRQNSEISKAREVIAFWFEELSPKDHWVKDEKLDATIKERFSALHQAAARGELWQWRESAEGSLAEVIVLDQFSRNMFRDHADSFRFDSIALVLAQEAIRKGYDQLLPPNQRAFLYLPFMHSESLIIHDQATQLFDQKGLENNADFERKHRVIIERFGRYPHRNKILGRESTPEEIAFLEEPGSSF